VKGYFTTMENTPFTTLLLNIYHRRAVRLKVTSKNAQFLVTHLHSIYSLHDTCGCFWKKIYLFIRQWG